MPAVQSISAPVSPLSIAKQPRCSRIRARRHLHLSLGGVNVDEHRQQIGDYFGHTPPLFKFKKHGVRWTVC